MSKCLHCGVEFTPVQSIQKYCGQKCRQNYRSRLRRSTEIGRKENSFYSMRWAKKNKERTALIQAKHRKSLREKLGFNKRSYGVPIEAQMVIWKRDCGKCQQCGSEGPLAIHHIDGVGSSEYKNGKSYLVDNSPSNLVLLCLSCHQSHHRKEQIGHQER